MTIDWTRFASNVPAGTRVKSIYHDVWQLPANDQPITLKGKEGILIRHGFYDETLFPRLNHVLGVFEMPHPSILFFGIHREIPVYPAHLEYLIGGAWVSYQRIMED